MPNYRGTLKLAIALSVFAICFALLPRANAGSRRFTYVYEATTAAPGSVESENWVTWKTSPAEERGFNQVDFRHELEFGLTEHLQLGIYLADWSYVNDPASN